MRIFFIISLVLTSAILHAQDYHFSQYNESSLSFNPALIGDQENKYKISFQRRSQWESISIPFTTTVIGFEAKKSIYKQSLGIQFVNDIAGDSKLSTTGIVLGTSRTLSTTEKSNLKLGLAFAVYQKKLDLSSLIFPQPNTAPLAIQNKVSPFFDISLGCQFRVIINNKNTLQIGNSLFHINQPDQSYTNNPDKLPIKINSYIHTTHKINKKTIISPKIFHSIQGKSHEKIFGSDIDYVFKKSKKNVLILKTGIYNRWKDAIICKVGIKRNSLQAFFSYDINISSLVVASNYQGAGEICLIYEWGRNKLKSNKTCPKYL